MKQEILEQITKINEHVTKYSDNGAINGMVPCVIEYLNPPSPNFHSWRFCKIGTQVGEVQGTGLSQVKIVWIYGQEIPQ